MNFSAFFIQRPVLTIVLSILIILFGIIGFLFLGVREYPSVDPPIITVNTTYTGANSDIIESQITEPLEESINGIEGIRSINSISNDGRSRITVEFELGVNMEAAANDVRDRVSRALRSLPKDVDPPIVVKSDADSEPILIITLQSDKRNLLELSAFANDIYKERLQTVPGVSEIRIYGEKKYSMKLLMDPQKMAAYSLSPSDIRNALNRENIELPSGRIEGFNTELTIRTMGRLTTAEEFNNLIIKDDNGRVIKFKDIGNAELRPENERSLLRGSGAVPMVGVAITPQPGSNFIAIADACYERIENIKADQPEDITVGVAHDSTTTIRKAVTEVQDTILIAFILVVLVIFVFLRHWRSTLIPVLAIPISLIGSFFIMYISGFSINILSLLGIVLATGLVVDDAIVVMENIYSKIEKGIPPLEAGIKGTQEIIFAIISTTVTLVAVFLPVIFLQGITGRLFREFGLVMAGAIIISSIVSLTLTPMLSSKILKKSNHHNSFFNFTEALFVKLQSSYQRMLNKFVPKTWLSLSIMAVSIALFFGLGSQLPSELAPLEDKSRFGIMATAPEGTSFEKMNDYLTQIIDIVDSMPEKKNIMVITAPGFLGTGGTNTGIVRMILTEPSKRTKSQQELADMITAKLRNYPFARAFVTQEQTIGGGRSMSLPLQYVIQAPDFESLKAVLPEFMSKANSNPAFQVVDLNLKFNKPEISIEIDRERAGAMKVSIEDIAETIQLIFSGQRYGYFIMDGKQYQVIGQADRNFRDKPLDLSSLYVKNSNGDLIQLDNLAELSFRSTPPQLFRYNRYTSATVSASTAPGYTLGDGIKAMDEIKEEVLDSRFSTSLSGVAKDFTESSNTLLFAFIMALILVYLILAAQFESFRDPLIIMLTVPLALAGAIIALWLFGQSLNIFSQIGIIMLIGIVTKNGILIVEFANQFKAKGRNLREAAIEAASQRLRPILMTSLATILGALPIALAIGASAQSRVSMGITIIGGLIYSLLLTLIVIPSLYTIISEKKIKKEND